MTSSSSSSWHSFNPSNCTLCRSRHHLMASFETKHPSLSLPSLPPSFLQAVLQRLSRSSSTNHKLWTLTRQSSTLQYRSYGDQKPINDSVLIFWNFSRSLKEEDVTVDVAIPVNFVKFQNVQSIMVSPLSSPPPPCCHGNYGGRGLLQLFVKENQCDEEVTRIQHLAFFGSPLDATKMSDFKRVAGEKGERHS